MKNYSNFITGTFLVILGLLLLMRNLNLLDFDIMDIIRLWPLALVYAGVEMLPVEPKLKMYLQIGVIILFFIALISLPLLRQQQVGILDYYEQTGIELSGRISNLG